jgi:hypothetical protein
LLPHEVFAQLHSKAPELFAELMAGRQEAGAPLAEFWERTRAQGDDWLRRNPFLRAPEHRVPIGIHGDDAEYTQGEKVLVLSWGSIAPGSMASEKVPTLDSRILFSMLRLSEATEERWP